MDHKRRAVALACLCPLLITALFAPFELFSGTQHQGNRSLRGNKEPRRKRPLPASGCPPQLALCREQAIQLEEARKTKALAKEDFAQALKRKELARRREEALLLKEFRYTQLSEEIEEKNRKRHRQRSMDAIKAEIAPKVESTSPSQRNNAVFKAFLRDKRVVHAQKKMRDLAGSRDPVARHAAIDPFAADRNEVLIRKALFAGSSDAAEDASTVMWRGQWKRQRRGDE